MWRARERKKKKGRKDRASEIKRLTSLLVRKEREIGRERKEMNPHIINNISEWMEKRLTIISFST